MQDLDHKHIIVTAAVRTPPTSEEAIIDWLQRLVAAVDMKVVIGPIAHYVDTPGNEGLTATVCIETSHSSIHVWDKADVPFLKFDLYSCKCFDPQTAIDFVREFDPYFFEWILLDRNSGIEEIARGEEQSISVISLMSSEDREVYLDSHRVKSRGKRSAEHKQARSQYAKLSRLYSLGGRHGARRYKASHRSTLSCIKARATKAGLDFDLTPDWYALQLAEAKSKYPKLHAYGPIPSFWCADVDRIDPEKGYTQSNCRIIPHGLNVAKWNWSRSELAHLLELLQVELEVGTP